MSHFVVALLCPQSRPHCCRGRSLILQTKVPYLRRKVAVAISAAFCWCREGHSKQEQPFDLHLLLAGGCCLERGCACGRNSVHVKPLRIVEARSRSLLVRSMLARWTLFTATCCSWWLGTAAINVFFNACFLGSESFLMTTLTGISVTPAHRRARRTRNAFRVSPPLPCSSLASPFSLSVFIAQLVYLSPSLATTVEPGYIKPVHFQIPLASSNDVNPPYRVHIGL